MRLCNITDKGPSYQAIFKMAAYFGQFWHIKRLFWTVKYFYEILKCGKCYKFTETFDGGEKSS